MNKTVEETPLTYTYVVFHTNNNFPANGWKELDDSLNVPFQVEIHWDSFVWIFKSITLVA